MCQIGRTAAAWKMFSYITGITLVQRYMFCAYFFFGEICSVTSFSQKHFLCTFPSIGDIGKGFVLSPSQKKIRGLVLKSLKDRLFSSLNYEIYSILSLPKTTQALYFPFPRRHRFNTLRFLKMQALISFFSPNDIPSVLPLTLY